MFHNYGGCVVFTKAATPVLIDDYVYRINPDFKQVWLDEYVGTATNITTPTANIPSMDYTELAYLKGDGDAYIDLGITLTQNDSITVTFQSVYTASTAIFGYRDSATSNNIMLFYGGSQNSLYMDFNNSEYAPYRLGYTQMSAGKVYKALLNKNQRTLFYYDGTPVPGISNTTVCNDNILTGNAYLFFGGGNPTGTTKFRGSIYNVVIEGRMNLIPARKNSTNELGMYDLMSGAFFTNANNVGSFTGGEVVYD